MEHLPEGLAVWDPDDVLVTCNRSSEVLVYVIWQQAFQFFAVGLAPALACVLFALLLLLTIGQMWLFASRPPRGVRAHRLDRDGAAARLSRPRRGMARDQRAPMDAVRLPRAGGHAHRSAQRRDCSHPAGATAAPHGWGNYAGPHHLDVPLSELVDELSKARPATIAVEGANPRHAHELDAWAALASNGKRIALGVIDTSTAFAEHRELVARRILAAAKAVGAERLVACTDCGLGTWAGFLPNVRPSVAWLKLEAFASGAELARSRYAGT